VTTRWLEAVAQVDRIVQKAPGRTRRHAEQHAGKRLRGTNSSRQIAVGRGDGALAVSIEEGFCSGLFVPQRPLEASAQVVIEATRHRRSRLSWSSPRSW
jgi:hypothetical protein